MLLDRHEDFARKIIREHSLNIDTRDIIFMKYSALEQSQATIIPKLSKTTPPDKLKEGEFCYDHKVSAEFSVGEGFDFKTFISATGNVSSFEMVDAIRSFYRDMKDTGEEESKGIEETLLVAASRIKLMGLTDESIS